MNGTRTCTVEDCKRIHEARGLCPMHYDRAKRNGSVDLYPLTYKMFGRPTEDRFFSKVEVSGVCWEWNGTMNPRGYGTFGFDGKTQYAHRWAWEFLVGPIPESLTVDHICRNTRCVNPDHFEIVTLVENIRRAHRFREVCPRGHSMDDAYIRPDSSGRMCNTCAQIRSKDNWAKSEMVDCVCGSSVRKPNYAAHRESKKHWSAINTGTDKVAI